FSLLSHRVTTKYRFSPTTGRMSSKLSNPSAVSTAFFLAAKRLSISASAPSGKVSAVMLTNVTVDSFHGGEQSRRYRIHVLLLRATLNIDRLKDRRCFRMAVNDSHLLRPFPSSLQMGDTSRLSGECLGPTVINWRI